MGDVIPGGTISQTCAPLDTEQFRSVAGLQSADTELNPFLPFSWARAEHSRSKEKGTEDELFALLDITYDYSANVATLEQISVRRQKEESEAQYTKRSHDVYNKRFKEVKANSYDRVVKLMGYVKRLGLPQELWPKEMEVGGDKPNRD